MTAKFSSPSDVFVTLAGYDVSASGSGLVFLATLFLIGLAFFRFVR